MAILKWVDYEDYSFDQAHTHQSIILNRRFYVENY